MADRVTIVHLPRVGHDAFAQVVSVVTAADPALGAWLHEGNRVQPLATQTVEETRSVFCFDDRLARAVATGTAQLGQTPRAIACVTAAQMTGDGGDRLCLTFATPTQFRTGRDAGAGNASSRRLYLFPDPARVFAAIWSRWAGAGWPSVPAPNLNRIGGEIVTYRLATFRAARSDQRGFVGEVIYDLRPLTSRDRHTIWALARFATYRGVGAHTSYGMGRVRIDG